jgi:hypothetical protein
MQLQALYGELALDGGNHYVTVLSRARAVDNKQIAVTDPPSIIESPLAFTK